MEFIIVCMCIILLYTVLGWWSYRREKDSFNDGICPKCGKPLKHFDNDSQGGQGWCCDNCGYITWVTWFNGDKYTGVI